MEIIRTASQYADSYGKAVNSVAQERKYLASTTGFPIASTRRLVRYIEENNLAQFFAIVDNEVVGWCDLLPRNYEGLNHVGSLGMAVVSSYRNKGIGLQLLNITTEHARLNNNIEKAELEVFEMNTNAVNFYLKFGFTIEGKRMKSRKLDGVYDNILLMGKFL